MTRKICTITGEHAESPRRPARAAGGEGMYRLTTEEFLMATAIQVKHLMDIMTVIEHTVQ